ncbi:MAG: AraC family transcriptional regulator, partial [Hyphomicrobium sp.]|nr:AraC family transcriptional regulator [Hyphomicrobium sp.]
KGGMLAALGEPRLAKVMLAMHAHPDKGWTVDQLADTAGMSRARFALHFRETVGMTPLDYLTDWRIGVAQSMLKRGKSLKMVAPAVGYTSSVALTRVFVKRVGLSPAQWLVR